MRRFLFVFLVLCFGFGPLTATLVADEDARLPACCRRNGAHHCAMSADMQSGELRAESPTPSLSAPAQCPQYPGSPRIISAPSHALATLIVGPRPQSIQLRSVALYNLALLTAPGRTHSGRGPPASTLA